MSNFWRRSLRNIVFLLSILVCFVTPLRAENLIVAFEDNGISSSVMGSEARWQAASYSFKARSVISASGVDVSYVELLPYLGMAIVRVEKNLEKNMKILSSSNGVAGVYIPRKIEAFGKTAAPNDPFFSRQFFHTKATGIDTEGAWSVTSGDSSLIVAVVDSGIDYEHEDLKDNMWQDSSGNYGYDGFDQDNDPMDGDGHGTHVAGLIAAEANNSIGVAGVAPKVKLMALRALNDFGEGTEDSLNRCINYLLSVKADGVNVKIANMSLGGEPAVIPVDPRDLEVQTRVFRKLADAGILTVIAAGNKYNDNDRYHVYPADYDFSHKIVVGATLTDGRSIATPTQWGEGQGSNYGRENVDIFAPGTSILSTLLNDSYGGDNSSIGGTVAEDWSGTSMATPIVSGVAALVWSHWPDWSAQDVRSQVLQTGLSVTSLTNYCVYGKVVNGGNALTTEGVLYKITGTVDASDGALEGVKVALESKTTASKTASTSLIAYTDIAGKYSFRVPNGDYTVTFTKSGYTFDNPTQDVTISGSNPEPVNASTGSSSSGGGSGCSTGIFSTCSALLLLPLFLLRR